MEDGWGSSPSIRKSRKSPPSAYALVAPIAPTSGGDAIKLKAYTENEPNGVEVSVSLKKDAATPVLGSTVGQKFTTTLTCKRYRNAGCR
ncbi:MAG: hypothetical protein K2K43_05830 [Alistipes sp.]|nr:hypothetical protein [Alistipes sp.]